MTNKVLLTHETDFLQNKLTDSMLNNKQILLYVKRTNCPYCTMMQGEWDKLCNKVKNKSNLVVVEIDKNVYKPERTPKFMSDLVYNTQFVPNVVMTQKPYQMDKTNPYLGFEKERTVDNFLEFVNSTLDKSTKSTTKSTTKTTTKTKKNTSEPNKNISKPNKTKKTSEQKTKKPLDKKTTKSLQNKQKQTKINKK